MSVPMRNSDIAALYFRRRLEDGGFDWEHFTHAPISSYISLPEIQYFDYIATSAKLAGKSKRYKIDMMSEVLRPKGFIYMTAGTNRVVFRNDYDQSFLLKIGFDSTGINDSMREFHNQEVLKPFVPKVFDVSPRGTVGLIERVHPILNRAEFMSVAGQIFDILNKKILGKYVLEDIGTDFFKNWGLRDGFGPVLLDYPYVYEIDGSKLVCNKPLPDGTNCRGLIDYDEGFNTLVCELCGRRHTAKSLAKNNGAILITKDYLNQRGRRFMQLPKVQIRRSDGSTYGDDLSVKVKEDAVMKRHTVYSKELKVNVNFGHNHDKIMAQAANAKPKPNFQPQQKMVQRGENNNAVNVKSDNTRSSNIVDRSSINDNTTAINNSRERNEQGRDLLKEAAVFMDILGYSDISARLKRMSHFKDGDEINIEVNDFKHRCRALALREFSDIEIKKTYDFDTLDQKYFNPEIPYYNQIDKENDSIEVVECKLKAIDAWYCEKAIREFESSKPRIPDINDPNAVWAPPITHKVSDQEPIDPKLMANQLYIDHSIEKANAGGEMKVKVKQEEPEQQQETTAKNEAEENAVDKAEYFDKKEVALSDKAEDLTSATDRAKIKEFMMNETSDFLDGLEKGSISNEETKRFVKEYLTEQCLKKYSKSDPEVLKVMVKEFVEENNMIVANVAHNEVEKSEKKKKKSKSKSKSKYISLEELRNIEY